MAPSTSDDSPPLPTPTTYSLGLEEEEEDDVLEEEHLFRWVSIGKSLLTYGGDNGNLASFQGKVVQRFDDGVRAVVASNDGKRIAVGFDTGAVRVYPFDDYENGEEEEHPFCRQSNKNSNNDVDDLLLSQDFPTTPNSYWMTHFEGPIRDLLFVNDSNSNRNSNSSTYKLVVAHEGGGCLVDAQSKDSIQNREMEQAIQTHHDHCGIRGVALSSQQGKQPQQLLATLAMDGRLCLWNLSNRNQLVHREADKCIPKADVGEVHGAHAFDRACRPVLGGECGGGGGGVVATPGNVEPMIRKVVVGTTTPPSLLAVDANGGGHMDSIVCLKPLLLGHHQCWVSSGRDGRLVVWATMENTTLKACGTVQLESPATDLWVDGTQVRCACAKGTSVTVDFQEVLESMIEKTTTQAAKHETGSQDTTATAVAKDDNDDKDDDNQSTDTAPDENDDDDDDDNKNKNKKTQHKRIFKNTTAVEDDDDDDDSVDFGNADDSQTSKTVRFVDDEAAEDDDDDDDDDKNKPASTENNNDDIEDLMNEDTTTLNKDDEGDDYPLDEEEDDHHHQVSRFLPNTHTVPPQPAFSPSSTPLDLTRRFLCWNHIGSITMLQDQDDGNNTIDITFTDSAYKRPISFTDNMHFLVGSLGEDGGVFASDLQEDDDDENNTPHDLADLDMSQATKRAIAKSHKKRTNPKPTGSSIYFYRFDTFANIRDKDWYLTLPDGERVLGSACGEGWAAVMTSRRFLRLFSSGGNQAQVVWLKGDPVTMTGRSRFLAVFYHEASPAMDGTQQLGYALWDAANFKVVSQGSVSCISKGSSLTWVGFNNDCSLMAMDSDGMLSMLVPAGSEDNWEWSPVLDTVGLRKSSDDQFWPITVQDGKLVCVPLKGGNAYPDASRRPVTSTLGLRMPLARASISKNTVLEDLSIRSNLALAQKKIINEMNNDENTDDFEREYTMLSAQVDKVTLKLFAATVDAGKLERALDLVDRLHLEKSFDLAIQLADHHRKLADLIEDAKFQRFAPAEEDEEHDDFEYDDEPRNTSIDRLVPSKQISPDHASQSFKMKRTLVHSDKSLMANKKVCLGE